MSVFGSIYVVTNVHDGKFYVGQTRLQRPSTRWSVHKSDARKRPSGRFHKAIRKHGADAFEFQVVATASSESELNALEVLWIRVTAACEVGYNLAPGGDSAACSEHAKALIGAYQRGRKASPETLARMSATRMGRPQSPAHRAARAAALKGRTPTLACRLAVAEANRKRVPSEATRAKLSAASEKGNAIRWAQPL